MDRNQAFRGGTGGGFVGVGGGVGGCKGKRISLLKTLWKGLRQHFSDQEGGKGEAPTQNHLSDPYYFVIISSGVTPANQTKERPAHELFAGAFRNKSSM